MGRIAGIVQNERAVVTRAATTALGEAALVELSNSAADITAFTGLTNCTCSVRATGAGKLVHSAGLEILQGAADITTAAGDTFDVEMITTTTCRIKNYCPAIVTPRVVSFTPTVGGGLSGTVSTIAGTYSRIGDDIFFTIKVTGTGLSFGAGAQVMLLPISIPATTNAYAESHCLDSAFSAMARLAAWSTSLYSVDAMASTTVLYFSGHYALR